MNRPHPAFRRLLVRITLAVGLVLCLGSCSPYGSLSIGTSFNVGGGGIYLTPSIGVGGFL
jgi:hypothetical protein